MAETAEPAAPEVKLQIRRARAADISNIVAFLNRVRKDGPKVDRAEIMGSFADKGFMIGEMNGELVGVMAWHVENLVACVEEFYVYPASLRSTVGPPLVKAMESAADQLMAEAALVFIAPHTPKVTVDFFHTQGYRPTDPATLVRAWKEAAMTLLQPDMKVLLKQLRETRTTKPI